MDKIGVAFGGGGARGIAHILMIEAFEELGIKPSIISGSSIGAIIGAYLASGIDSKEMKIILDKILYPKNNRLIYDFLLKSDVIKALKVFDPQFIKSGLIKGDKFQNLVMSNLKAQTFEELEIPLKLVSTDYHRKEEVIFEKGNLAQAVRASYSLPGLFTPLKIDNRILIDGGAVNPLPFDILINECDITVALDVSAPSSKKKNEIPQTFDSIFTTYQTMQNSINQQKMKFIKPDIYIKPEILDVRVFDFTKDQLIFKQAKPAKEKLKRKLEKILEFKTTQEYVDNNS